MKQNAIKVFAALLVTVLTSSVWAGNVLRFKAGNVDTTSQTSPMSSLKSVMEVEQTEYFVIQFKDTITESDRARLSSEGIEVFRYIPEDAYLVKADASTIHRLETQWNRVQAVLPYHSSLKMSPEFSPVSVFNSHATQVVMVQTLSENDLANVGTDLVRSAAAEILYASGKVIMARLPRSLISEAAQVEGIEWVQPYVKMELLDVFWDEAQVLAADNNGLKGDYTDLNGYETGTKIMNFEAAWSRGFTGAGQIVAMADTGLDSGDINTIHVDFKGAVRKGINAGVGVESWKDPMGHGTHVAGSVLGRGTASGGALKGGAYNASIIAEGLWSTYMDNIMVPPQLKDLFAPAYAEGARVHTNSWGSGRNLGAYDSFANQADEFMWNNPDMLIVFAAGNSGKDGNKDGRIDGNSISSPGTAKNVLTVGASENLLDKGGIQVPINKLKIAKDNWPVDPINSDRLSNNADGIAAFSSRGPTQDGRIKPEVVAPGTNILSTRSHIPGASELWGVYNADYCYSGGTSMATPLTAGAVAVAREYLIKVTGNQNPTAALMKALMMHTAKELFPGQFGLVGASRGQELLTLRPNSDEGFGRVDMAKLVTLDNKTQLIDNVAIAQGETMEYKVPVSAAGKLLATMVYTDAPGSTSAQKALVNDIDLVVVDANGKTYSANDSTNNYEMQELSNLPAGQAKVQIKGKSIPQGKNGKQPFALIVTTF